MNLQRINLVPEHRRRFRRRQRMLRWCVGGCSAYALLLVGGCVLLAVLWKPHGGATDADVERVLSEGEATKRQIDLLNHQLAAARNTLRVTRQIADQPDWSLLLALLGKAVGEQVVLNGCEVGPAAELPDAAQTVSAGAARPVAPAYVVRLRGLARGHPEMSQFVLRLEQLGLFGQVMLVDTGREPIEIGEAVSFRIECSLGGRGKGTR